MLTEAVCARHQLCCSKEERHAAEREKNRESGVGEANCDGGELGRKNGICTSCPQMHCPVEINQNGYQRLTEMLKGESCSGEKWLWVKLKGFSGFCVSSGGFREGFVPGG